MSNIMTTTSIQPILFTLGLFSALNTHYNTNYTMRYNKQRKDCIEFDEVQLGYIMNDDAVSSLNEIKALWESLKGFLNPCFVQGKKYPPIMFPLIKYFKSYIVSYLFDNYPSIAITRWTCEDPKLIREYDEGEIHHDVYTHCGKCTPCKKLIDIHGVKDYYLNKLYKIDRTARPNKGLLEKINRLRELNEQKIKDAVDDGLYKVDESAMIQYYSLDKSKELKSGDLLKGKNVLSKLKEKQKPVSSSGL